MRAVFNLVGRVSEFLGNNHFAYKMYLEGFRYSNNHNNTED